MWLTKFARPKNVAISKRGLCLVAVEKLFVRELSLVSPQQLSAATLPS